VRKVDALTKRWIRNEADARAAAAGCRFDESRGQFVVDWLEQCLVLYEGECAGQPFICHDWQYEATMRLFGWVRHSERWNREIRRFRQASIWIPKKNKKSPTLAGWALYMLAGDGEPGQKVFLAAKDGNQARQIAGKHAVEMVLASPLLSRECSINRVHMSVTHERTRSVLMPLSSSNERTQQSKEGLNGSIFCDEVHVVDRAFMSRITRAGISRSEPLHVEVSTAGNNPDCYGKERYDYGKLVEAGEIDDHQLFFLAYEAPQDLTDERLAKNPVRYGKLANPAWGHTVGEEEYLADYHSSSASIQSLADFKMYRLNIWQRSANPWLRKDDWQKCARRFTAEDLAGRRAGAGLDLSKTQDMTALSLIFPEEHQPDDQEDVPAKLLTWYWLPEGTIARHGHEVPYRQWVESGHLRVIRDSDVIVYSYVLAEIAEILRRFDVGAFAYDEMYARDLTQRMVLEHGVAEACLYPFPQTIMRFAGPTARFERMILAGKLEHDGNPITTWQAGHVQVKRDNNDNLRPVKPPHADLKKIDGIVSAIMALDASGRLVETQSVYEGRGVLSF
jgi:phage terminase large subunit-like protein